MVGGGFAQNAGDLMGPARRFEGIGDSVQHKPVKTLLVEEGLLPPEEGYAGKSTKVGSA